MQKELIYFVDPMCSWCWGFSPVILSISQAFPGRVPVRVVLGGLFPGTSRIMNEQTKHEIREHWGHVNELSGQPFNYDFFDRTDAPLGTPHHALILAASSGHSDAYQHVIEEVLISDSRQGGTVNPKVRADMVYFEYPNGGAVFSTGSIAWCGALSQNNYDNNVSRITGNVLRRFASSEPMP